MTTCRCFLSSIAICLAIMNNVQGFCPSAKSPNKQNVQRSRVSETSHFMMKAQRHHHHHHHHRREFLSLVTATVLVMAAPLSSSAATPDVASFQVGQKLSVDEAKARFVVARKDAQYLLDNYSKICEGGGDNVRRYLGTVGNSSGMFGIRKVVKQLQGESGDIVEYTEAMDDFEAYLNQAEGAAYQSLFIEHSSAKGTPAELLATAKQDVIQMIKYMDLLALQLE